MALEFIGIDPETGKEGSPTVWVDVGTGEIVIQGWTAGEALTAEISGVGWSAGHEPGIPDGESVIRMPVRMVPILREACDAADRAGLL
ncbi:hypothetical protein J5Y04_03550 [Kitasatospora sp. RG8]|uniref:hypothetical protein n=1 Tax=Kitasatospora sp. RG8 TaxID=2820815 RepID=UPI001AE057CA|nr:hypothetical protein [Kitasatospora sp. RG8]MBP0448619.1 hypothetical protein [Kitasatospora sp. RG8]